MYKLYNGDCLEVMKTFDDEAIDLVVTSPPYDNLRDYNQDNFIWNDLVWEPIINELYRVVKKGGVIVWVVGDSTVNGSETGNSFEQALYFKRVGFNIHDTMIYQKSNFSMPSNNRYHQIFEYMFIFSKNKPKTFNPLIDRKNINVGDSSLGKNSIRMKNGQMKMIPKGNPIKEYGKRYNIWRLNTAGQENMCKQLLHPAQFPLKLANDHILSWSNENDIVLDCFMGSGTTGVACMNTNRQFIGIELDENYHKIAEERICKTKEQNEIDNVFKQVE